MVVSAIVWSTAASVPTNLTRPGYLRPLDGLWPMQAPLAGIVSRFDLTLGQSVSQGKALAEVTPSGGGAPVVVLSVVAGVVSEIDTVMFTYVSAGQTLAVVNPADLPSVVYSFLPTAAAGGVPPGLPVHVDFGGGVGATYGFAKGHVESISVFPPTEAYLTWLLPEVPVASIGPVGAVKTAVVMLDTDAATPSGIALGSGKGAPRSSRRLSRQR